MSDKRQKNQLELAFAEMSRSEAPRDSGEGTETLMAKRDAESAASIEQLMEEVCGRKNCQQALVRVKSNKGSAGIDGMTVEQLPAYLKQHWPTIREQLLSGTYKPQPVKRVEIPKPDGGGRVRSQRAGERVMKSVSQFITRKLKLKVNEQKSAVSRPSKRKFLGFSFSWRRELRRRIAPKAITRFKQRVRELTRRTRGVKVETWGPNSVAICGAGAATSASAKRLGCCAVLR